MIERGPKRQTQFKKSLTDSSRPTGAKQVSPGQSIQGEALMRRPGIANPKNPSALKGPNRRGPAVNDGNGHHLESQMQSGFCTLLTLIEQAGQNVLLLTFQ